MDNQIVCPNCGKTIANQAIIDDAAKGEGSNTRSIVCECGERMSYWNITAQLRDQKTLGYRFKNWIKSLTASRSA